MMRCLLCAGLVVALMIAGCSDTAGPSREERIRIIHVDWIWLPSSSDTTTSARWTVYVSSFGSTRTLENCRPEMLSRVLGAYQYQALMCDKFNVTVVDSSGAAR